MNVCKRLFTLTMALLMLIALPACTPADDQTQNPDPPTGDNPPTDEPLDGLGIVVNGASTYCIVRSDYSNAAVTSAAMSLRQSITDATGCTLTPRTDWEETAEGTLEIIVGDSNRAASDGIAASLEPETFTLRAIDGNIVLVGADDTCTAYAVDYFIQKYVVQGTTMVVPENLNVTMTRLDWLTKNHDKTVTLKTSYSDYITDYSEEVLISFDEGDEGYSIAAGGYYDDEHSIDGCGALRWDIQGENSGVMKVLNQSTKTFSFDASNKNTSTIKFWLYVSNTANVICDHDEGYGIQGNQATFYFRAIDKNGRTHCWNHTITNDGWHEIELSFNIHNGYDANFDYANVTSFWFGFGTYGDVTVMIDDMRGVNYATDYVPAAVEGETNARLISDAEYNALDGAILQEWYGASYDLEDKMQGNSSLRCQGDATVNDFRTIVANLNINMNYDNDILVFHLKIKKLSDVASVFIELNEVQDQHEYQASFTIDQLKGYGLSDQNDTWSEIRIPLSVFSKNLGLTEQCGEDVQLCNFRFVASASGSKAYDYHIDHIYLCEK